MKNCKRRTAALLAAIFCLGSAYAAGGTETQTETAYADQLHTGADNAYVLLGEQCEGHYAEFIEGTVRDSEDPLYSEVSAELGLTGRKFYKANYASVNISKEFYEPGDHEFLVSIMYYDYGPAEGRFHLDYCIDGETTNRISLVKTGKVQDWFTQTVYVDNADLSAVLPTGGNIRVASNAYNLFKKIEIVNLSKLRREGKAADINTLPGDKRDTLLNMRLIDSKAEQWENKNLYRPVAAADAARLLQRISGHAAKIPADNGLTQGALIQMYADALGLTPNAENLCAWALETGLSEGVDLLLADAAPASNYNLLCLTNNALFYQSENRPKTLLEGLIDDGFFDSFAESVTDEHFFSLWYKKPRYCPYRVMRDNETKQIYYYMNIFGQPTWRPYVTAQSWSEDGKTFVCSLANGEMFLYNTETQMLTYVDKSITDMERLHAYIGTDDYVYYIKREDGNLSIWKSDIHNIKPEFVTDGPPGLSLYCIELTNDCQYMSMECGGKFVRYSVRDNRWDIYEYNFPYSNTQTHAQVNPEYENLMFFAHEMSGGTTRFQLRDRMWVFDCDTQEAVNIFKQGTDWNWGYTLQYVTHEVWSKNGEHLYAIGPDASLANGGLVMDGNSPFVLRVDKDGSHRRYYYDAQQHLYGYNHCYPSGDDRYVVADGSYLVLVCTETNQHFPIASHVEATGVSHPYQAHPVVARNQYMVNWGARDEHGILGVKWMDFSSLAAQQAPGGHYAAGENLTRASYKGLVCESYETEKKGRNCIRAKSENAVYLDIDESLIDTDNGSVVISFDYLDNGTEPLIVTYTSGVVSDDDRHRVLDRQQTIKRTGTNRWKHCEFTIKSGNFEDIADYGTDLTIRGQGTDVYLSKLSADLPSETGR